MTRTPLPNYPEYYKTGIGIYGPKENKTRLVIVHQFGRYSWNWKRPKENHFIYLGPVEKMRSARKVIEEMNLTDLVASIY